MTDDVKSTHRMSNIPILTVVSVVLLHVFIAWLLIHNSFNLPSKIMADSGVATEANAEMGTGSGSISVQFIEGSALMSTPIKPELSKSEPSELRSNKSEPNKPEPSKLKPNKSESINKLDAKAKREPKSKSEHLITPEPTAVIATDTETDLEIKDIEKAKETNKVKTDTNITAETIETTNSKADSVQSDDEVIEKLPVLTVNENRKITQHHAKLKANPSEQLTAKSSPSIPHEASHYQVEQGTNGITQNKSGAGEGQQPEAVVVEEIDWIEQPLFDVPKRLQNPGAPIIGYTLTLQLTVNTKGEVVEAVTVATSGNVAIDMAMERIAITGKMRPLTDEQGRPKVAVIVLLIKLQA